MKNKIFGYCRISTKQQSIDRQIRNITAEYPTAVIYQEAYTGTKLDRPEWTKLLKKVKAGDTIVFDSVSRMSRNAGEGFAVYQELYSKGVALVFLKEPQINTSVYQDAAARQFPTVTTGDSAADEFTSALMEAVKTYMLRLAERQIAIAFEQAQKEVDDLHQRTKEGIVTARINGKQIGQIEGAKLNSKIANSAKAIILKYSKTFGGQLNDTECMTLAKCSRPSFYKYKAELKAKQEGAEE